MQPTLICEAPDIPPAQSSDDISRPKVGFVAGTRPHFADETAELLRTRSIAAASVVVLVLGAAFVGNLAAGTSTLWWLRWLVLLIAAGSLVLLKYRPSLTLTQLRIMELVVFGAVATQLSLMLQRRLLEFAASNDATSLAAVILQLQLAWCLLIFVYGTLIPNTWQRGAAVMLPVAFIPYLLITVQSWQSPEFRAMLAVNKASTPLPVPLVAALIATFATHVINTARREAFKSRQFGQYRLLEKLGSGGMGEVYKAEHVLLKRPCAIKLIKAANETDASAIARFEKEVKSTARLTHWNTIEIYDYGRTDDGTFFYVMELLPGLSLQDLVDQHGPLPPGRVIHLLRQICGALYEAHSAGLIHRDIKPANIFATQQGGVYDVAKLLDFGLVKERNVQPEAGVRSGSFSGTPLYMSPEQASRYDEVDGRADIYSLGAVAYYLLTGQTPFSSRNMLELLAAHRYSDVTPPSQWNAAVTPDLEHVILKCLAKIPADRFQDAEQLRKALDQCAMTSPWDTEHARAWWKAIESGPAPTPAPLPAVAVTADYQPTGA